MSNGDSEIAAPWGGMQKTISCCAAVSLRMGIGDFRSEMIGECRIIHFASQSYFSNLQFMNQNFITSLIGYGVLIGALAAALAVKTQDEEVHNEKSRHSMDTRSVSKRAAGAIDESGTRRPPAKTKSSGKDQSLITKLRRDGLIVVGGGVRDPGPLSMTRGMTLSTAIQRAGGATEFGSLKRVKVTRDGEQRSYDMTNPEFMNIPLKANDRIDVPRKVFFGN